MALPKMEHRSRCALKALMAALMLLAAALLFLRFAPLSDLSAFNSVSRCALDREGEILGCTLTPEDRLRVPTDPHDVDPLYLKMLLASEDRNFPYHPGVDPLALCRAALSDLRAGRIVSGGSTLAMQVSRMLTRKPRTVSAKISEIFSAVHLTLTEGRQGVLSMYLTLAPFGGNIEGLSAASVRWFGHLPDRLSPEEAALLVALPRAPELIRPDRHPEAARYYRADVLRLALERGIISKGVEQAAAAAPLPEKLLPFPRKDPGLTRAALRQTLETKTELTLDPRMQRILAEAAKRHREAHPKGILMSAVVIDNRSHEIAGWISGNQGETELALPLAVRSPGSALKPFAYALALEKGLVHPRTLVSDKGKLYGSWEPRNFSGSHQGELTLTQALVLSLNLPALEITERLSPEYLVMRLNSGKQRIQLPGDAPPSAAVILGGCGVSLWDLAALYTIYENQGMLYEPMLIKGAKAQNPVRLMSQKAAEQMRQMLRAMPAPEGFAPVPGLGYKTGTSHGSRDAWAAGSLGPYTAAVWSGRPDGTPCPGATGLHDAAPYLLQILTAAAGNEALKAESGSAQAFGAVPQAFRKIQDQERKLKIVFPPEGSKIAPDSLGGISIRTEGGACPCYLSVDGVAQPDPKRFVPKKSGKVLLIVTDSKGQSAGVRAEVVMAGK